jgi:hypothetical protein
MADQDGGIHLQIGTVGQAEVMPAVSQRTRLQYNQDRPKIVD